MAPKRVLVEKQGRRAPAPKGYIASTYDTLTSPDNASVVRSIAVFGVSRLSDDCVCILVGCGQDFLCMPYAGTFC